jgi:DUF2075 family protein
LCKRANLCPGSIREVHLELYRGTTFSFLEDAVQHRIAEKLGEAFLQYFDYRVGVSEFSSWQNSLMALAMQIRYSNLLNNGILLEMQLPRSSSRLDALITGKSASGSANAVLIELKQWTSVQDCDLNESVVTFLGGKNRTVPHPSIQASTYAEYLADNHSAFQGEGAIALYPCTWLHNLTSKSSPIYDRKFSKILKSAPLFAAFDADRMAAFLRSHIEVGDNAELIHPIIESKYQVSKHLLDHVAEAIDSKGYTLLDDQIVALDTILSMASTAEKTVILISGGPGTGKSLIALRALGELSRRSLNAQYVTGSKAFTENLRKLLGRRAATQFKYTHNYVDALPNEIDVLIVDEAHRVRETSNSWRTPRHLRSSRPQIHELIEAARISVFFVDNFQVVKPGEVGSASLIRQAAAEFDCCFEQIELTTQFRCGGSGNYVEWLNETLGITAPTGALLDRETFDFRIFDSVAALRKTIDDMTSAGRTARMTAGFCWKWSDPNPDGTLAEDVVIGDFRMPWDAKPGAGKLAKGIPQASYWATDPNGIGQVGCVYNAQGFEFEYVGVIFGRDLVFDEAAGAWKGQPQFSADPAMRRAKHHFANYVANAYRVLMTRGLTGCYVYFMDENTRAHFERAMETRP